MFWFDFSFPDNSEWCIFSQGIGEHLAISFKHDELNFYIIYIDGVNTRNGGTPAFLINICAQHLSSVRYRLVFIWGTKIWYELTVNHWWIMGGISQIRCCSLDIEYCNLFEKYYGSIWAEQQDKILASFFCIRVILSILVGHFSSYMIVMNKIVCKGISWCEQINIFF